MNKGGLRYRCMLENAKEIDVMRVIIITMSYNTIVIDFYHTFAMAAFKLWRV